MNTKEGAAKAKQTRINNLGGYDNYKKWLKDCSTKGGANGRGHTWAHGKADPRVCGKIGGRAKKKV